MFVKDIIERKTDAPTEPGTSSLEPRPRLPGIKESGFPAASHRREGGRSAFARARKRASTPGSLNTGEGKVVESVPQVISADVSKAPSQTSSKLHSAPTKALLPPPSPLSEAESVRRQVDADNSRQVASMSSTQRENEANELKERFGNGIVELMRQRRARRAANEPTLSENDPTKSSDVDVDMMGSTLKPSDAEEMSPTDVPTPCATEGSTSTHQLHRLAPDRDATGTSKASDRVDIDTPVPEAPSPPSMLTPRKGVRFAPMPAAQERTPAAIRSRSKPNDSEEDPLLKYFPDAVTDDPKLAWMESTSSSTTEDPNIPRFDLSGAPLSPTVAASLPTHLGLHHHGESPELAGYTISEVIHLCYSTVTSQRITMIGVLAKIIARYSNVLADLSTNDTAWTKYLTERNVLEMGTNVAVDVLSGRVRSVGVLAAAVDLLFWSLGAPNWSWLDSGADSVVPFHPEPAREGEPTGIETVPLKDLTPRLVEILGMDDAAVPRSTLAQLLFILRRAAVASPLGAEAVASVVPAAVKAHVLRAPWPLDPARPPSISVLGLLHDVVLSSRDAAAALLEQNVFEPLLKFIVMADMSDPMSLKITTEILGLFYSLGRYGLGAGSATTGREAWYSLGQLVSQQLEEKREVEGSHSLIVRYFDLLRIWTICSIDPHRTTPEHDLTWAQTTAMHWVDEELSALRTALRPLPQWEHLGSILAALMAFVDGSTINGVRQGDNEKREVIRALKAMNLAGHIIQSVNDFTSTMSVEASIELTVPAVTQVFRLHNALRIADDPVLRVLDPHEYSYLFEHFFTRGVGGSRQTYLRHCILVGLREHDSALWAAGAFDNMLSYEPGDEPLALALCDELLRVDWTQLPTAKHCRTDTTTQLSKAVGDLTTIGHKDGLEILRPLLHHAIMPEIEYIVGPTQPNHLYLKATGTLRLPATMEVRHSAGLPLPVDWTYSALDELLSSGSSSALALAPKDWDASETQLVRATLAFAHLRAAVSTPENRSFTLLNCMKVFMLEHGQLNTTNSVCDVFRDDTVAALLKTTLDRLSTEEGSASTSESCLNENGICNGPLETTAVRFLGPGVPFFQFYTDVLALFEAISFGDLSFARVVLPPLAMSYPVDYRKLFWAEQPSSLRSIRLPEREVPLESGTISTFYFPFETDREVLAAQTRALATTLTAEDHPFLFGLAVHHVAGLLWANSDTSRNSPRVQLLVVILSSAPPSVIKLLVEHDLSTRLKASNEEVARRIQVVGELTGPRAVSRLQSLGFGSSTTQSSA